MKRKQPWLNATAQRQTNRDYIYIHAETNPTNNEPNWCPYGPLTLSQLEKKTPSIFEHISVVFFPKRTMTWKRECQVQIWSARRHELSTGTLQDGQPAERGMEGDKNRKKWGRSACLMLDPATWDLASEVKSVPSLQRKRKRNGMSQSFYCSSAWCSWITGINGFKIKQNVELETI